MHVGHLGGPLPARAGNDVVHAHRDGAALDSGVVGEAHRVHQLRLLELFNDRLQRFEGQPKTRLDRRSAQLVGECNRAEEQAGDEVTAYVKVLQPLGCLDRPGLHRAQI